MLSTLSHFTVSIPHHYSQPYITNRSSLHPISKHTHHKENLSRSHVTVSNHKRDIHKSLFSLYANSFSTSLSYCRSSSSKPTQAMKGAAKMEECSA